MPQGGVDKARESPAEWCDTPHVAARSESPRPRPQGEDIEEAARRELREETGVTSVELVGQARADRCPGGPLSRDDDTLAAQQLSAGVARARAATSGRRRPAAPLARCRSQGGCATSSRRTSSSAGSRRGRRGPRRRTRALPSCPPPADPAAWPLSAPPGLEGEVPGPGAAVVLLPVLRGRVGGGPVRARAAGIHAVAVDAARGGAGARGAVQAEGVRAGCGVRAGRAEAERGALRGEEGEKSGLMMRLENEKVSLFVHHRAAVVVQRRGRRPPPPPADCCDDAMTRIPSKPCFLAGAAAAAPGRQQQQSSDDDGNQQQTPAALFFLPCMIRTGRTRRRARRLLLRCRRCPPLSWRSRARP